MNAIQLQSALNEAGDLCRWWKTPSGYQNVDTEVIPKTKRAFELLEQMAGLLRNIPPCAECETVANLRAELQAQQAAKTEPHTEA